MQTSRIARYARFGEWAANFGLLIYFLAFSYLIYLVSTGVSVPGDETFADIKFSDAMQDMNALQRLTISVLWKLPEITGVILVIVSRNLFVGFRTEGVLIGSSARRLQTVGWVTTALAPVRILTEMVMAFLLSFWQVEPNFTLQLSLEDTDIYALIIGLVIIIASKITLEAIDLYTENGAFV